MKKNKDFRLFINNVNGLRMLFKEDRNGKITFQGFPPKKVRMISELTNK